MVHTHKTNKTKSSPIFTTLRAQREAQPRRSEDASPPQLIFSLSAEERGALVEALPQLAEESALELLISVGGCFSCGDSFKGSVTIISLAEGSRGGSCPRCGEASLVALNLLNERLSELLGAPSALSAFEFGLTLEEAAQRYFARSPKWLAYAALDRRTVGGARLIRQRAWREQSA